MDPYLAEIRAVAFDFVPRGWAHCDGRLLPIAQNTRLFSLLGTAYGGDGKTTFALPDLQGRVVLHAGEGTGPGLSEYQEGDAGGVNAVTLLQSEMPAHGHALQAAQDPAELQIPAANRTPARSARGRAYRSDTTSLVALAPEALPPAGGGVAHDNLPPVLTVSYIIALEGIIPPRP